MVFVRGLGWGLLVLALVALGFDLVQWAQGAPGISATPDGGFHLSATGEWWYRIHPNSLQLAQPAIERHLWPWLWDPVILTVLLVPAAVLLAGLGLLVLLLARRRHRPALRVGR